MQTIAKTSDFTTVNIGKEKLQSKGIHGCVSGCATRGYELIVPKCDAARASYIIFGSEPYWVGGAMTFAIVENSKSTLTLFPVYSRGVAKAFFLDQSEADEYASNRCQTEEWEKESERLAGIPMKEIRLL